MRAPAGHRENSAATSRPFTHLDLFSGIGGFALAASWAGLETVQFVEIDPFCQRVLAKNFPGVPIHDDVRTFDATEFRGRVSLLTGGFPCQDISPAGTGAGIDGSRSGLWFEMVRILRGCSPLFVLAENSHFLRTRGADRVLDDLEQAGYTAWPVVVGAGSAGAPHLRRRAFVVAAYGDGLRELQPQGRFANVGRRPDNSAQEGYMAADPRCGRHRPQNETLRAGWPKPIPLCWRDTEPPVPGVVDGLPNRVDRARALGNAVVPQVVYPILAAISEELALVAGTAEGQGTARTTELRSPEGSADADASLKTSPAPQPEK